jgi:dTDP-glucose 4,6-dehydratase
MTIATASPHTSLFDDDLHRVLERTRPVWKELRGARIFVTGGTGFFGKWLLETFVFANVELELDAELVVLSRDPRRFLSRMSHLESYDCVRFHQGDVRTFEFPTGRFSHVIHAATDASAALNENSPATMLDVIVAGTERIVRFAEARHVKRLLLTSSGAVYGNQPDGVTHVSEDVANVLTAPALTSAYGQGKRVAENLCVEAHNRSGLSVAIARCFAFVGPHLPLDRHFAIGNFLRDALAGSPISVRDGRPFRSYMYAADLATWLWTILVRGISCRPYNVGSEQPISIADVAGHVADLAQTCVELRNTNVGPSSGQPAYYVPDTKRARCELGLTVETDLPEAITRTFKWYSRHRAA